MKAVIHCAAVADLYETEKDKEKNFRVNVLATDSLAKFCAAKGVHLYYISTCCAYGNNQPADENTVPHPTERYAASKVAGEFCIMQYGGPWTIFRCPTMYGPGMRESLFIYQVIHRLHAEGGVMYLNGPGDQVRQYGYITDVANRIAVLMNHNLRGQIVNLNSSERISNIRVVSEVSRYMQKEAIVFFEDRNGDIYDQQISNAKMNKIINGDYTTPFAIGIQETIAWYLRGRVAA